LIPLGVLALTLHELPLIFAVSQVIAVLAKLFVQAETQANNVSVGEAHEAG